MIMIHGTKVCRFNYGWTAEYCPICHAPRVFELTAVQKFRHVNFIAMKDAPAGSERHMLTCPACGLRWAPGGEGSRRFFKYQDRAADEMYQPEFQELLKVHAEALQAATAGRAQPLRPDSPLLGETLDAIQSAWELQEWIRPPLSGFFGALTGLLLLLLIFVVVLACVMISKDPTGPLTFSVAILGGVGVAGVYLAYRWLRGQRFVRRTLLPLLGRALAPYNPAEDALAAIPEFFRTIKSPLRHYLNPDSIRDAVLAAEARAAPEGYETQTRRIKE